MISVRTGHPGVYGDVGVRGAVLEGAVLVTGMLLLVGSGSNPIDSTNIGNQNHNCRHNSQWVFRFDHQETYSGAT